MRWRHPDQSRRIQRDNNGGCVFTSASTTPRPFSVRLFYMNLHPPVLHFRLIRDVQLYLLSGGHPESTRQVYRVSRIRSLLAGERVVRTPVSSHVITHILHLTPSLYPSFLFFKSCFPLSRSNTSGLTEFRLSICFFFLFFLSITLLISFPPSLPFRRLESEWSSRSMKRTWTHWRMFWIIIAINFW